MPKNNKKTHMKNKKNTRVKFSNDTLHKKDEKLTKNTDHNNVSYSLYVDEMTGMEDYRRKMKIWITDDSVISCYNCKTEFSMWYRKHHCRMCGKIFCYYCSNNYIELVDELKSDLPQNPYNEDSKIIRTCDKCKKYMDDFNKYHKLIQTISNFDINTIQKCKYINSRWEKASIYCLNKLRDIQYKLSVENIDTIEKKLLLNNMNYFSGHSRWLIQIIKTIDFENKDHVDKLENILKLKRKNLCIRTMCTRICTQQLSIGDILDILHLGIQNNLIKNIIKTTILQVNKTELIYYFPFFAFHLEKNSYILDIIIKKFFQDNELVSELYWCILLYNTDEEFKKSIEYKFEKYCDWDNILKMKEMIDFDIKTEYKNIINPINPNETYTHINNSDIQFIESASKPIIIPFVKQDGTIKKIMYKKEDIRKDHVIVNLIEIAYKILKDANIINTDVITYKVSPISPTSGYIEIVEESSTIFNITENLGFTVQNYISEHNNTKTVKEIKDKFIQSTAVYCVLSYLLGIGDRHLDNIMISKTGLLFHIDFSYIMGKDPKYNSSDSIKISPEIINMIGGYNSDDYTIFKKYCVDIYNTLRLHVNLFMNMLSIVSYIDNSFDIEYIKKEILTRFEIGVSSLEASLHLDTKINLKGYTFEDKVIDFLYKSKNSNLFRGISYIKNIPNNLYYSS